MGGCLLRGEGDLIIVNGWTNPIVLKRVSCQIRRWGRGHSNDPALSNLPQSPWSLLDVAGVALPASRRSVDAGTVTSGLSGKILAGRVVAQGSKSELGIL